MARKTLLNEAEIRRFMKLANMGPLGNEKMEGMYPGARDDELEATEDELGGMDAMADEEGAEIDDLEGDLGAADDELSTDDAMDDMGTGEGMMISVDDFMAAFETAMEEVTGEEVDSTVDLNDEGALDDADPEGLEGGDISLDGPEAEPVPDVDPGAMEDELAMQEQLVNKVAARVAKRLVKENRKTAMTDELTERIFKRLTQRSK
jgi:hypothetical protein